MHPRDEFNTLAGKVVLAREYAALLNKAVLGIFMSEEEQTQVTQYEGLGKYAERKINLLFSVRAEKGTWYDEGGSSFVDSYVVDATKQIYKITYCELSEEFRRKLYAAAEQAFDACEDHSAGIASRRLRKAGRDPL